MTRTPTPRCTRRAQANGFRVWKTRYATIGVLICWDQWFPEAARITSLLGADILFYPTAIGWHPAEKAEFGQAQVDAWRTAQRAHAIANGVFVAAPNRVGHEDEPGTTGLEFFGHSFICRSVRPARRRGGNGADDARRDLRSAPHRGDAAQLAVPARPPDRRLRADPEPLHRRLNADRADSRMTVRFPAECEPHAATWIAWPHHEPDWPGKIEPIAWVYAEIVRVLATTRARRGLVPGRRRARGGAEDDRGARRDRQLSPPRAGHRPRLAPRFGADRRRRRSRAASVS